MLLLSPFPGVCSVVRNQIQQVCISCDSNGSKYFNFFLFPVAQDHSSGVSHLIVEVSRSHVVRDTQLVGLLYTSDQLVAEVVTSTTQGTQIITLNGIRTRYPRHKAPSVYTP
jgi:hypothetical protein